MLGDSEQQSCGLHTGGADNPTPSLILNDYFLQVTGAVVQGVHCTRGPGQRGQVGAAIYPVVQSPGQRGLGLHLPEGAPFSNLHKGAAEWVSSDADFL